MKPSSAMSLASKKPGRSELVCALVSVEPFVAMYVIAVVAEISTDRRLSPLGCEDLGCGTVHPPNPGFAVVRRRSRSSLCRFGRNAKNQTAVLCLYTPAREHGGPEFATQPRRWHVATARS